MNKIISVFAIALMAASCNNGNQAQLDAQQRSVDSMKMALTRQQTIDSMNAAAQQAPVNNEPVQAVGTGVQGAAPHHSSTHNSYTTNNTTNNNTSAPVATAPVAQKKKGWSGKAIGTLAGAGVGAITGAMVDKKKGEGAVVGGILGAGAGLGTGAIIDAKKKKQQQQGQ